MSVLFSAGKVAEEALRLIGAYSPSDDAADGIELDIALTWLDLNMAQLAGSKQLWFLVQSSSSIALTADQASYNVNDLSTVNVQFPQYAQLDTGVSRRDHVTIVSRQEFDRISTPTAAGDPTHIHIDRQNDPTMRVYPVPSLTGRSIILTHQGFAPDIASQVGGNVAHGLSVAWQRWGTLQTAIDIGSGPIRRLQSNDIAGFERRAADALTALMGFNAGSEHTSTPPIAASSDAIYDDNGGFNRSDYGNKYR